MSEKMKSSDSEEVIEMGVFEVEIKVRNWQNRFLPEEERGEEIVCEAVVDSGAIQFSLPAELIERLKLIERAELESS